MSEIKLNEKLIDQDKEEKYTKITFKLNKVDMEILKKICDDEQLNQSNVVRKALANYYNFDLNIYNQLRELLQRNYQSVHLLLDLISALNSSDEFTQKRVDKIIHESKKRYPLLEKKIIKK
jgi:hypothetical protein